MQPYRTSQKTLENRMERAAYDSCASLPNPVIPTPTYSTCPSYLPSALIYSALPCKGLSTPVIPTPTYPAYLPAAFLSSACKSFPSCVCGSLYYPSTFFTPVLNPSALDLLRSSEAQLLPTCGVMTATLQTKETTPTKQTEMLERSGTFELEDIYTSNSSGNSSNDDGTVREFICPLRDCGRKFKSKFSLHRHHRQHLGIKPYPCQYPDCRKTFSESNTLRRHLRTHTGEKPFVCEECGRGFSDGSNWRRHTEVHAGQKRHKCPFTKCKVVDGFSRSAALKKHILNKHAEELERTKGAYNWNNILRQKKEH